MLTPRRILLLGLVPLGLVPLFGGYLLLYAIRGPLLEEQYRQIQDGMLREEVHTILGQPSFATPGLPGVVPEYHWDKWSRGRKDICVEYTSIGNESDSAQLRVSLKIVIDQRTWFDDVLDYVRW